MIRYRLPHEDLPGYYICKWCGASAEAIEDGRKPRYCAKNRKFKAPGYLSEEALEQICIEISKRTKGGLALNVTHALFDVLDLAEPPLEGFQGWGFPKIMETAFNQALLGSMNDGIGFYNIPHPIHGEISQARSIGLREILDDEFARSGKPKLSAEEHCKWLCAWKGGGPCLADDCPRRQQHENGDGV